MGERKYVVVLLEILLIPNAEFMWSSKLNEKDPFEHISLDISEFYGHRRDILIYLPQT